jgi:signal transduction histidine kinase
VLAPAEVNAVVDRALALMEAQLAHRKVVVERRLDPGAPKALLDADRLTQALLNVILNAADAMPNGGTLTVATSRAADGGAVALEIADDGVGLPPGVRERVFEPFFTTKRDGVGLGLVNTRSVVERHGGSITLEPGAPRGTRAVITLPFAGPVSVMADAGTGEVG